MARAAGATGNDLLDVARNPETVILPAAPGGENWLVLDSPVEVLSTSKTDEVLPLLEEVERASTKNVQAAGFLAYESAPAFDSALKVRGPSAVPLAWFALFDSAREVAVHAPAGEFELGAWEPSIGRDAYGDGIDRIREYLQEGDTYQVNFTLRMQTQFSGDPLGLFYRLTRMQRAGCCAYIETPDFAVCSASPELFFLRAGTHLEARPMKGTARRGLTCAADERAADALRHSGKDRAENVMIVDMVRNDMGRIAEPGSVRVKRLFEVEHYPTVLQMTSTVECETHVGLPGTMRALFPCASITGAPKVRTMEIIRELEKSPRGIYTGCIGHVRGPQDAWFNVAIRTVWIDRKTGRAEYGVGGGIVWDSDADAEYEECATKARVLHCEPPEFELLETMLWEREKGLFLLELHMQRLIRSARYFGFRADIERIRAEIEAVCAPQRAERCVIRLRVGVDGDIVLETRGVEEETGPRRVAFAPSPVDTEVPWLYHKTTCRSVYEEAKGSVPGVEDIILWNERGEVTETTISNIVIEAGGEKLTPPLSCGLLAGVYREWLLARGEVREQVLTKADVQTADRLLLINSVRGVVPAILVDRRQK